MFCPIRLILAIGLASLYITSCLAALALVLEMWSFSL
jgi:hypothetical protein